MREHNRQTDKKCENEHLDMIENVNVKTRESGLVSEREMERVSLCVGVCVRERESGVGTQKCLEAFPFKRFVVARHLEWLGKKSSKLQIFKKDKKLYLVRNTKRNLSRISTTYKQV